MMNITVEQFVSGLERSARELPNIEWMRLDPDLADEYLDQLDWLLQEAPVVMAREDVDAATIARIEAALGPLKAFRAHLKN